MFEILEVELGHDLLDVGGLAVSTAVHRPLREWSIFHCDQALVHVYDFYDFLGLSIYLVDNAGLNGARFVAIVGASIH